MKTLVVLSALASIALAAPSFLADEYKNTFPENWPEYIRRERKSPQGYFYAESAPLNFDGSPVHIEAEQEGSSPTARSFGLKKTLLKPTIIKRPSGYHIYRDSAEERAQADPSEDCSKQVKVKFCNGEKTARSTKEEAHEEDMESSIKMAKEAIEHLQRDLKNIEQGPKSASWSETDMHEDIEVARKALEHVHKNFGNLESMNLHSTLVDDKLSHQTNDVKAHEERASQWKEHTKTFTSNVEGARNMEDIVKLADEQESFTHMEGRDSTKFFKNSENMGILMHDTPLKHISEDLKNNHERSANTDSNILSDMNLSETKMKEAELDHHHQLIGEKSAEANIEANSKRNKLEEMNIGNENTKAKASKLLTSDKKQPINEDQIEVNNPPIDIQLMAPASSQGLSKVENNEHLRKSNEQEWNKENNEHLKQAKSSFIENESMEDSATALKSNHMKSGLEDSHINKEKNTMKAAHNEKKQKMINDHNTMSNDEKLMTPTHIPNEKSASSLEPAKDKLESLNMRWAPMNKDDMEKTVQMKEATEFHNQQTQSGMKHHHFEPTVAPSNHMETKTHPVHAHSMKMHDHEHSMNHAKSADFNEITSSDLKSSMKSADFNGFMLPNLPSSLLDFSGKSAMDLMQWSHKTDGGRSAYGSYGGSGLSIGGGLSGGSGAGSGAVGVFPNARVGGCAVPLLLSCSPSVVSGSLAKSGYGSSYGSAPAYRGAEELTFHNKRDTKKLKNVASKKNIKPRTTIMEKKQ